MNDLGGEPSGSGVFYDGTGAAFDLVINEAELSRDDSSQDTIRAGVVRGSRSPSSGGGSSEAFELSFSGCLHPASFCLR